MIMGFFIRISLEGFSGSFTFEIHLLLNRFAEGKTEGARKGSETDFLRKDKWLIFKTVDSLNWNSPLILLITPSNLQSSRLS
ncbi:MAG: hypothetical protein ACPL7E_06025, partial [bacterium]